jgi:hypothetical protein
MNKGTTRTLERRPAQSGANRSQLEPPWQDRIPMLEALCKAGLSEQEGRQALERQEWRSAEEAFERSIAEILGHFQVDISLLNSIKELKTQGASTKRKWPKINSDWQAVLRQIRPQVTEVCKVEPPFETEVITEIQQALAGMEETYRQAGQLLKRWAWWKAFKTLRAISSYRDASVRMRQLLMTMITAVMVGIVALAGGGLYAATATSTPTPQPITFTIQCADGKMRPVDTQEPVVIPIKDAVIIETNLTPRSVELQSVSRMLTNDVRQFPYGASRLDLDTVKFTFFTDQYADEYTTKSLTIKVVPREAGGLCYQ